MNDADKEIKELYSLIKENIKNQIEIFGYNKVYKKYNGFFNKITKSISAERLSLNYENVVLDFRYSMALGKYTSIFCFLCDKLIENKKNHKNCIILMTTFMLVYNYYLKDNEIYLNCDEVEIGDKHMFDNYTKVNNFINRRLSIY